VPRYDVLVIGGGIAGVSIAYELASTLRVGLLEMESTLAYHTTGRSAATWIGTYGSEPVRALTRASYEFLVNPPADLYEHPLTKPLRVLHVGGPGQRDAVEALHHEVVGLTPTAHLVDAAGALERCPVLRADWVTAAVVEPGALEVDVHALHQGYRRGLRMRGGEVIVSAKVVGAERAGGAWQLTTATGEEHEASEIVVAAGAWVDEVGALFGARPVGIEPRLRSAYMIAAPPGPELPMTMSVDPAGTENAFYFKPDGAQLLCSPSDETLVEAGDAKPDELEIARSIEAINDATTLGIRSIRTPWAGLRSFVADHSLVIGRDPLVESLHWFAGQGGYGIQTAPAAARLGAALLRDEPVPDDIAATGLTVAEVDPGRLGRA
jgi:D-arginine dehydrogenase